MIGIIIMSVTKMLLYCTVCKKSNERIHNNMAACLLRATMPFFAKNDSGIMCILLLAFAVYNILCEYIQEAFNIYFAQIFQDKS